MNGLLPPEGGDVSYVGQGEQFGSQGQYLASAGPHAGHVKWANGPRAGLIDLVDTEDLVPMRSTFRAAVVHDELDDSLEVGGFPFTAVRQVQQAEGTVGLLNFMASSGHLSGFAGIAEESLAYVAHKIRQDPGVREVTAQLDEDEAESLVRLAAHSLLRDAFGDDDE